jgi:hydrogenase expression/formation protein HypD
MKYVDEYRDKKIVGKLAAKISSLGISANLMEVCGGHTMSIFKYGIKSLLPDDVKLLTGPGCPVCVTGEADVDAMISLSDVSNAVIATFGDMMKVPGSSGNLAQKKASGADIRVVYSPLDALAFAEEEPDRPVIFLGVGFETTTPGIAATVVKASEAGIRNFYVYSTHKIMPPALRAVLTAPDVRIDGFILPGHVSTILGSDAYDFLEKEFRIPSVIGGFEPVDILASVYYILRQMKGGSKVGVEVEYKRAVKPEGNLKAKEVVNDVFELADVEWRGFGVIPVSGLEFKKKYSAFNAKEAFGVKPNIKPSSKSGCVCGDVLRGAKNPLDCKLFAKVCNPDNAKGPCMVSTEGACSSYYKYGERH